MFVSLWRVGRWHNSYKCLLAFILFFVVNSSFSTQPIAFENDIYAEKHGLEALFEPDAQPSDPLLELAGRISESLTYGQGVSWLSPDEARDADSVARIIRSSPTAHCGNFAFLFVYELLGLYPWTVFGLDAPVKHARHAVVEVNVGGRLRTYDPTLGLVYDCSIKALRDGSCNYASETLTKPVDPRFDFYRGKLFFYQASIVSQTNDIEALVRGYQRKDYTALRLLLLGI